MKLHLPKLLLTAVLGMASYPSVCAGAEHNLLSSNNHWTLNAYTYQNESISKTGWGGSAATYDIDGCYAYVVGNDSSLTFSLSYIATEIPDKNGIADNDSVFNLVFSGAGDKAIMVGSDYYGTTSINYGLITEKNASQYFGNSADKYNLTSFKSEDGNAVVRKENQTYQITGTVSRADNGNYSLTLNLLAEGNIYTANNIDLGDSFDIRRIVFSSDGGNRTLTGLSITGDLIYDGYLTTVAGNKNAAGCSWVNKGAAVNASDINWTDGSAVIGLRGTGEDASFTFAAGTNVSVVEVLEGAVTLKQEDGNLTIGELASYGNAVLASNMTINSIAVGGEASIAIADNAVVSYTGSNMAFLSNTTGAGTIVLSNGGEIAPNTTSDFAGVLDVAAGKTLKLSPGDQKDKSPLDIEDATVRLNARSTLWIQGHGVKIGAVDVVDTSTMQLFDGNENKVATEYGITVGELKIAQGKTLTVTDDWEANLLIESLNAKGSLALEHDKSTVFITIGSIAESGAIKNVGQTTLGIDGKSVLNLGGSVTNTGTLTIKGNLAGTSTISGGTINLASTASVSGDITFGSNINIAETLVNTGSVTLGGDVYIDSMVAMDGDVVYSANGGKDGFITSALYYVVKGDGDTAASSLSGEFTLYEGSTAIGSIIQSTDGKSLVISVSAENVNNDIYYVNTQDMTATAEDAARATGYVVADGLSITANHTGESKVINSSNISIGSNATLTLNGNIGIEGTGDLNNGGTLNFGGNALKSTAAAWNWKGNINISSDVTVSGGAISIAQGCTVTLLDGASLLRNEDGAYRVKGTIAVADNAVAELSTTDDIHFNYPADADGEAVLRLGAGSTLDLTAKSFQHWGERGYIELGADSKLNVSSANFQIRDLRMDASSSIVFKSGSNLNMNAGSIEVDGNITMNSGSNLNMEVGSIAVDGNITLNEGANLNMQAQGNQTIAGNVILNGGKIISENGGWDNRVKTINHLSGSGEIVGSSWNVIWNIGELAGDGDITWRNNGTHWAPSVLNINGGTFTGTLTADRATGKAGGRGNYQSVLQINEGGANTLAGAVVNLQGNGEAAYMQMALNTAEVSIGGLEGTQYSHIYAGSAGIEGGENNQFCKNKATSTGTSVLKLASDENHTYAGSVGAGISLEKSGAGMQTFSGDMSAFNGSLKVIEGELAFTATEALKVNGLYVGPEKNAAAPAASEGANVGILTVANGIAASGAVTLVGGAVINGNLDLSTATDVSFDVTPTPGTGITLNGALTMSSTKAFVDALDFTSLSAGDILTVFTGVSSFTVGDVTYDASNALTNVDLRDWGADAAVGQYTLTYDTSANVGSIVITVGEVIPEPTTATLSLLALMGLAARRRRK